MYAIFSGIFFYLKARMLLSSPTSKWHIIFSDSTLFIPIYEVSLPEEISGVFLATTPITIKIILSFFFLEDWMTQPLRHISSAGIVKPLPFWCRKLLLLLLLTKESSENLSGLFSYCSITVWLGKLGIWFMFLFHCILL